MHYSLFKKPEDLKKSLEEFLTSLCKEEISQEKPMKFSISEKLLDQASIDKNSLYQL